MAPPARAPRSDRKHIPQAVADEVAYLADLTCCACRERGEHTIHHLDGNALNGGMANLVLICASCQRTTNKGANAQRWLSPGVLRRMREQLLEDVRMRRARALSGDATNNLVDAVATERIRTIGFELARTHIGEVAPLLDMLAAYGDDYGISVRSEVLHALEPVAARTRGGLDDDTAKQIVNLMLTTIPVGFVLKNLRAAAERRNRELLQTAIAISFRMAYDGVRHLKNLTVANSGARILCYLIQMARRTRTTTIMRECIESLDSVIVAAKTSHFEDAVEWLEFLREEAMDEKQLAHLLPAQIADRHFK